MAAASRIGSDSRIGSPSNAERAVKSRLRVGPQVYGGQVNEPAFSPVAVTEQVSVYETLASAFTDDPVERWLYPDLRGYVADFPRFVAAFGGRAFEEGTVWRLGAFSAVALWLPPGTEPDADAIVSVLTESVGADKHEDTFMVLSQMETFHPTEAHWYLPWFGVPAALQGKGLGSVLMEHCLRIVDQTHLPAYLETPNPRTIPFYERHSFAVTGRAQAGACPPIACMWRDAH
jgi:GNAT superfamily N-acetyltransferase